MSRKGNDGRKGVPDRPAPDISPMKAAFTRLRIRASCIGSVFQGTANRERGPLLFARGQGGADAAARGIPLDSDQLALQPHMPHSPVADTSTKQFGHIARMRSGTTGLGARRSAAGRGFLARVAAAGAAT